MAELCQEKVIKPVPREYAKGKGPMQDGEAIHFEEEIMQWGRDAGKRIGMIDPEYLVWISGENEFMGKLKRYIQSNRFKQRMRYE